MSHKVTFTDEDGEVVFQGDAVLIVSLEDDSFNSGIVLREQGNPENLMHGAAYSLARHLLNNDIPAEIINSILADGFLAGVKHAIGEFCEIKQSEQPAKPILQVVKGGKNDESEH